MLFLKMWNNLMIRNSVLLDGSIQGIYVCACMACKSVGTSGLTFLLMWTVKQVEVDFISKRHNVKHETVFNILSSIVFLFFVFNFISNISVIFVFSKKEWNEESSTEVAKNGVPNLLHATVYIVFFLLARFP